MNPTSRIVRLAALTRSTNRKGRYKFTNVQFDGSGDIYVKVRATSECVAATSGPIFIGGT